MTYCTVAEVKAAINFPTTDAPITDAQILEFIHDSEEEIANIYKTKFGNIEISGTADGDYSTTTFSDSTQSWTVNEYIGYVIWIYGGTGEGQYREITTNSTTKITVSPAFDTTPDATSNYRITKLGYSDETVDGTGSKDIFTRNQPLINLNAATSDSISVTVSTLYIYPFASKLVAGGTDCEITYWSDQYPQLVNLKYVWGVYPLPRIIKRLCICIAGMRTLISQIAGTYDDFTAVTMPGLTASKGEPYMNIKSALDYLQGEARGIVFGTQATGQVSADFRTATSYRPFTLFE